MSILGIQLILVFFGTFMFYLTFIYWKKKLMTTLTFFVWIFIWLVFLFLSLFPKMLEPLTRELFIIRAMDFGMIVAFMILTFLTVDNNVRIKKYENQLEKVVREIAIKKVKKAKK